MNSEQRSVAEIILEIIAPALVMVLVGSFVMFLVQVFYHGEHTFRLNVILMLFTFAAVLIGRISIEQDHTIASLYAIPLGVVTFLAMMRFVEISGPMAGLTVPINLFLIGLVWYFTHKLVWDCTFVDLTKDVTAKGLLDSIGTRWRKLRDAFYEIDEQASEEPTPTTAQPNTTSQTPQAPWAPLWKWFKGRKANTPGLWVVYFSIITLPTFGLAQGFIPASDTESRQWVFKLFAAYILAGLGLLMTTSLIGLMRYLHSRSVEMPNSIMISWLTVGSMAGVLLLFFAWLLPRPAPEYSIARALPISFKTPDSTRPNQWAVGNDGKEGGGQANSSSSDKGQSGQGQSGQGQSGQGQSGQGQSGQGQSGQGQSGQGQSGQGQSGQGQSGQGQSGQGQSGQGQSGQGQSGQGQSGQGQSGQGQSGQGQSGQGQSGQGQSGQGQSGQGQSGQGQSGQGQSGQGQSGQGQSGQGQSGQGQSGQGQSGQGQSGQGQSGQGQSGQGQSGQGQSGQGQSGQGQSGQGQSGQGQSGQGQSGQGQSGQGQSGQGQSGQGQSGQGQSGQGQSGQGQSGQGQSGQGRSGQGQSEQGQSEQGQSGQGRSGGTSMRDGSSSSKSDSSDSNQQERSRGSGGSSSSPNSFQLPSGLSNIGNLIKILAIVALIVLLVGAAIRYHREIIQGLKQWLEGLARWWSLFAGRKSRQRRGIEPVESAPVIPRKPFSSYANPFRGRAIERATPEELVTYSFQALEAWAFEAGSPRREDQTPIEFAKQLSASHPDLSQPARAFTQLVNQSAYAPGTLNRECLPVIQQLWDKLERQPRSATAPAPA